MAFLVRTHTCRCMPPANTFLTGDIWSGDPSEEGEETQEKEPEFEGLRCVGIEKDFTSSIRHNCS